MGNHRGTLEGFPNGYPERAPVEAAGMTREEFVAKWRAESDTMRRRGVTVPGATLCDEILRDFETVMDAEGEALLTLEEASARSGYSRDHLGKLIRDGKLPNAGRWHAPRVRARDLPNKPGAKLELTAPRLYDPHTDARNLSGRQRRGFHDRGEAGRNRVY
jgi:hypothetical protein